MNMIQLLVPRFCVALDCWFISYFSSEVLEDKLRLILADIRNNTFCICVRENINFFLEVEGCCEIRKLIELG